MADGGTPVGGRIVALQVEVLVNLQGLQVIGNAAAGGFQPGLFQGPDPEEGFRVIACSSQACSRGEPAANDTLPVRTPGQRFEIQPQTGLPGGGNGRQAMTVAE